MGDLVVKQISARFLPGETWDIEGVKGLFWLTIGELNASGAVGGHFIDVF